MKRFSARWLALGCILTVIVIIANVTVTYRNTEELYQSAEFVAGTHDVLSALSDVLSLAKDAETGQRGYIITGEETYLEPFHTAVSSLNHKVNELEYLTLDNPEQRARIPALRSIISAKFDEMNRTIMVRRNSGPNAARAVVLSGQGKIEMDALRAIVGEMTLDEQSRRNESLAVRDKAFQAAIREGLFSGIVAVVSIIVIFLLLRRHSKERERSALIIAEQSERLRTTLASIGDGVIVTDAEGNVTTINAVAEILTGWSNREALGVPLRDVLHIVNESTRAEVENPALRALKEGVIVGLANHTILIAKDGTERPIDDSAAPIRNHDGEIIGSVLVFRDISERYRAEAEQRAAQEQIFSTLESVTDGFMRYDKDWRIVYVNAQAETINRLTRAEMIGRNVWEIFPALVGTHFEAEFLRAVAEQVTVEFENHYEPFGRWYSLKGYPTVDGGLTTFIRDITTQKESEIALRTSEERLAFVRRSSGVGFWYCDLPFDVLEWDELVKAHFHLSPDAAVTIDTFYERIHPDDREPTREAIEQSISGRTHYDTNYRTVNPGTGAVTWVRAIGRTFYSDDGTPTRFDGVTLDVSDQKRAEREIVRLADESERQRRLYETVLTNTPDFMYVFSLDHKVVYANEALITMWGRGYEGAIGKTFLEIGYEPWHAEMHDREIDQVAATKQPIRGEVPFTGTHGTRKYDYIFVPVFGADGEVEAVAGTTRDVTERKEGEELQAFLIRLADSLRPIYDPVEVQSEASRLLGEHLGANRVAYFEILGDDYVIERDYVTGVRSLVGQYPVAAFGPAILTTLLAGRTIIEGDATTEPNRPLNEREAFAGIQVRGHVDVPLVKAGQFVAGMTVQVCDPRKWTQQEIALIEETAERTWAAVERVRAEAALRDSEARYRAVVEGQSELVCRFRTDGTILFANGAYARAIGAKPEDLEGSNFWSLIPAEDRASVNAMLDGLTPDAPDVRIENRFLTDAGERWMLWTNRGLAFDADGGLLEAQSAGIDITDRKKAEAALRESEERFRLVADAAPVMIWMSGADNLVNWYNRAWLEFTGRTMEEEVGHGATEVVHPDDLELCLQTYSDAFDAREPFSIEYRLLRHDGQYRWMICTGVPRYRADGGFEGYIGSCLDVTDYKDAQAEIKALSDYNRNVLESISDPLFTVDREWQFTYMSGAGEQLLGYRPGELIGKNLWKEFPGVVGSEFETPYRQAMEGIPGRVTAYYPDHKRWYEANMFPGPTGVTVYFRNVTKRIRREQNLTFLANLLKDFTQISTVDGIIRLGASRIAEYLKLSHCIFAEINEAANEAVIVYDHHEVGSFDLAGTYALDQFLERDFEIPRLAAGSVISVDDVSEEPRSPEAAERFKALGIEALVCAPYISDGRWMFVLAACHNEPCKWSEDEIQLLQDLSARVYLSIERARAEEKLSQARDELEVRVQERTAELAVANIELRAQAEERNRAQEERVRLLGQIISSQEDERHRIARDMHDDLGQRLTALRLHLESVGGLGGDEFERTKLAEIRGIAKELDSDLSSIVWRLRPAALDNVGVISALEDYVNKWSAIFNINVESRSVKFDDSSLSAEIQTVLYRITQEALNNIHKYAEARTVSVILDKRGQDIILIVEDDGKGFELSHNKDPRKGFGLLGMSERAALVGGVVEIESAIGKGTSIYVRIPAPID